MDKELPDSGINPKTHKPVKRSTGWFGINTIYGRDDDRGTPYMTRAWIGRLRLHIFHRGDSDPDPHDHPWPFWTFPLTSYVEEVTVDTGWREHWTNGEHHRYPINAYTEILSHSRPIYKTYRRVVPAWAWSFRPATHCHRVLGRYSENVWDGAHKSIVTIFSPELANKFCQLHPESEPYFDNRKIITIVWRGKDERKWGFLKHRDGRWCWVHWKEYVFNGGKSGPCE